MKRIEKASNLLGMLGALACALPVPAAAQTCPLRAPTAGTVEGPLATAMPLFSAAPEMVSFTSKLSRDEDGNPRAYHRGLESAEQEDDGLDHICNGMSVLELSNGELRNRYGPGGSGGNMTDGDDDERHARSLACKRDYITLRDAGFPRCGQGPICSYFFGIAASPRACGYVRGRRPASDTGCGVPILQRDPQGRPTGFYLTTNTLFRPGTEEGERQQADYADALVVPFIVMPGRQSLPTDAQWQAGDLAVVVWRGRVAYAVVGDTGPAGEIGEASRALLTSLGTDAVGRRDPATTLLFPGTAARTRALPWPLTPEAIRTQVRRALDGVPGGIVALRRCPGLEALE